MSSAAAPAGAPDPVRRFGAGALAAELDAWGSLRHLRCGTVSVNLFPAPVGEAGTAMLVLRRQVEGGGLQALPLSGPASPLRWCLGTQGRAWREAVLGDDGVASGWPRLRLRLELVLAGDSSAWFWHLAIDHLGGGACTLDLVCLQDVALAPWDALRLNEAYVSQYLDHQPLAHPEHGWMLATRQNAPVGGRHPWLLYGSLGLAAGFATDALQLVGPSRRDGVSPAGLPARLPSVRMQHEHALLALQESDFKLAPGESATRGFFGIVDAHHPAPSGPDDLSRVAALLATPEARWTPPEGGDFVPAPPTGLFARAPRLASQPLDEAGLARHAPGPWRQVERDATGALHSLFCGEATHVVLPAKEHAVLRPHGHILRSGRHAVPDELATASTAWMSGVFHSSLTQGHASANRLLSTQRGYLGLARGQGLRAFADWGDGWRLLAVPSAWTVAPDRVQWIYRHDGRELVVCSAASDDPARMTLHVSAGAGPMPRLLIAHHVALDGDDGLVDRAPHWTETDAGRSLRIEAAADSAMARRFPGGSLRIDALGDCRWSSAGADGALQPDGRSVGQPFACLVFEPQADVRLAYTAELLTDAARPSPALLGLAPVAQTPVLDPPAGAPAAARDAIGQLAEWLPWLQHNALVHYLSPRGLEQFSGGGWGTRDVCQGPVELLAAQGRHEVVRDLLCRVFSAQNPDGDWPQWFMFHPRDAAVRAGDSHGDIVFWPLLALAEHLAATGDAALLDEPLPFHAPAGTAPVHARLRDHAERAWAVIARRRIAGTALAAYWHGDWNDALQPADPAMREHLCSAWTVTLHYRTLRAWGQAWRRLAQPGAAARAEAEGAAVLADFQRLLVADGVLAGYASFDIPQAPRLLLHPRDRETGIRFSALAMVHAIIDELFTPAQAAAHADLLSRELSGPDGLRLFDRPLAYRGGPMTLFQRGESASYFGREIGLMYMHAHLRWAEALAQLGRGEDLLHALRLANPIGLQALVPSAAPRQSSCYYSSSDAAFADRREADAHYGRIARGEVALEGGWRIYSSGAGIAWRLVVQRLLGIAQQADALVVDPVLPAALDGLQATLSVWGEPVRVHYRVGPRGHGPLALQLDGRALPWRARANRYRAPGVAVSRDDWRAARAAAAGGAVARLELVVG